MAPAAHPAMAATTRPNPLIMAVPGLGDRSDRHPREDRAQREATTRGPHPGRRDRRATGETGPQRSGGYPVRNASNDAFECPMVKTVRSMGDMYCDADMLLGPSQASEGAAQHHPGSPRNNLRRRADIRRALKINPDRDEIIVEALYAHFVAIYKRQPVGDEFPEYVYLISSTPRVGGAERAVLVAFTADRRREGGEARPSGVESGGRDDGSGIPPAGSPRLDGRPVPGSLRGRVRAGGGTPHLPVGRPALRGARRDEGREPRVPAQARAPLRAATEVADGSAEAHSSGPRDSAPRRGGLGPSGQPAPPAAASIAAARTPQSGMPRMNSPLTTSVGVLSMPSAAASAASASTAFW